MVALFVKPGSIQPVVVAGASQRSCLVYIREEALAEAEYFLGRVPHCTCGSPSSRVDHCIEISLNCIADSLQMQLGKWNVCFLVSLISSTIEPCILEAAHQAFFAE